MHHYKLEQSDTRSEPLKTMLDKIRTYREMARAISVEVGAIGRFESKMSKGGGIYAFGFDEKPDTNLWKKRADGWFPKKQPDLQKRIDTLPYISVVQWANVFKTDVNNLPGIFLYDGVYWICSFLPLEEGFADETTLLEWRSAMAKLVENKE